MAALSLTLAAPALVAQQEDANPPISINLVDADIAYVLRALMEASKANIVLEGGISGQVTCQLQDIPLEQILDAVTGPNSLYWHKKDGIYFVTKRPFSDAPLTTPNPGARPVVDPVGPMSAVPAPKAGPVDLNDLQSPVIAGGARSVPVRQILAHIPLRFMDPGWFTLNAGRYGDPTIERMRSMTPASAFTGFQPMGSGGSGIGGLGSNPGSGGQDLMQRLANSGISSGAFPGGMMNGLAGAGSGAQQFPGGLGGIGGGGGGFDPGLGGGGGGLGGLGGGGGGGNTSLGTVMDLIMQIPGITSIVPYYPDNSLLVLGTEEAIAELRKLIEMLDRPPKQVRIEAQFLQVSMGDAENFGFNWAISDGTTEVTADLASSGDLNVRFARGNFAAQIQAFKSTHRGNTIIAPKVTTQNNVMAVVQSGHTGIFFTPGSAGGGPFGAPPSPPQPVQYNVQIQLPVLPRINGDNSVTMLLQPQVTDISGFVTSPAGGSIPILETQAIQIPAIRVKDGETLVLGGLVRRQQSHDNRRLPFFSQLPLVGNLFKNNTQSNDDVELLIFVTPTVLPGEEEVEGLASATQVQAVPVGGAEPAAPAPGPGAGGGLPNLGPPPP